MGRSVKKSIFFFLKETKYYAYPIKHTLSQEKNNFCIDIDAKCNNAKCNIGRL